MAFDALDLGGVLLLQISHFSLLALVSVNTFLNIVLVNFVAELLNNDCVHVFFLLIDIYGFLHAL